jgi:hypothetical protein
MIMDFLAFEQVINKIDGVINSKIIYEDDQIQELHVLANYLRSAKQIVRDIESSLIASFNYRIDRRVISIAQIHTEELRKIKRIKFDGVTFATSGNEIDCTVKLMIGDEEFKVTQTAVKTSANRKKVVAESTVKTIEEAIGKTSVFDVQDVIVTSSRDISFASVIINIISEENEETLIGSSIIKSDVSEAIARAALDALNRRLEKNHI